LSSTIISVSFIGETSGGKIILDSQDKEANAGDLFFTHIPSRMYRVDGSSDLSIEKVAIKLHSRNSLEEEETQYLYDYCGDWKHIDSTTTEYIFPKTDTLPRKRRFVDEAIYMYDGCPCDTIPGIGKTLVQLRPYIYKNVPTHTLKHAQDALTVFTWLKGKLTADEDRNILVKKIANAGKIVGELENTYEKIYGKDENKFPTTCNSCPKTWLDDEPIKRILRGY
jgi:hypothetical protein